MRACYRRGFHMFAAFSLLSQAESAHRDSRSMKRKRITCHMLCVCLPIYVEAARVVVHVHMSLQRHGTLVSVGVCVLHVFVARSCTLPPTTKTTPTTTTTTPNTTHCNMLSTDAGTDCVMLSSHGGTNYSIGRTNGRWLDCLFTILSA